MNAHDQGIEVLASVLLHALHGSAVRFFILSGLMYCFNNFDKNTTWDNLRTDLNYGDKNIGP